MGRTTTWLACSAVAAAIVGAGALLEVVADAHGIVLSLFALLGSAYLVGTFSAANPLFGGLMRTRTDRPELALTFDDGPDPRFTPQISSLLARRGHRATFFVLGARVRAHPRIISQIVSDGHEVASHGDDHRLLAFSPPAVVRAQLDATEGAVRDAVGRLPAPLFRAPHGVRSPWLVSVARRRGYRVCAWDGSVLDTANPGVETIAARVKLLLRPGAIVLLHDGDGSGRGAPREQTVAALEPILDELERRGLRSVTLGKLAITGEPPEAASGERSETLRRKARQESNLHRAVWEACAGPCFDPVEDGLQLGSANLSAAQRRRVPQAESGVDASLTRATRRFTPYAPHCP